MSDIASDEKSKIVIPIRSIFKMWWINSRERIAEWYRIFFHTILVTVLLFANVFLSFSSLIIYIAQWKHTNGGSGLISALFGGHPPSVLMTLAHILIVPLDQHPIFYFLVIQYVPVITWLYSTNTVPITKGYKTMISWKSRRGRVAAALMSAIPFMLHYCALFAWYIDHYLFDFFDNLKSDKEFLVVKSMASFGYMLMSIPVALCVFGVYRSLKELYMNDDLRKMFFKWEYSLFSRQSFSLHNNHADVIVGWEKKTHKPIVLHESSRYIHEIVVGATGSGKTSTVILMRIVQDLIRIARGKKMGVVILEPKGDLCVDTLKLCEKLGIPKEKIKIVDPTDLVRSVKFNPFMGPLEAAAETFRGTLDAIGGEKQDEFFKGQQAETASLYTMLGKIRHGHMFNILHIQRMYTDPRYLADMTEEVRKWIEANLNNPDVSPEDRTLIGRYERVVSYFENEVLEYKTWKDKEGTILPVTYSEGHKHAGKQVIENKKDKFITGVKKYINDICMNAMLSQLMVANDGEEALDMDAFLKEGGVLVVNTALGSLEELSLSFGQFFIRQFQSSVFRRPSDGNGFKRFPVICFIDEFPLYANQAFERMLTLGRSYKVGTLIAIQSLGQLQNVAPGYDRTILANASNKTVFGRGEYNDNELFSKQFGEEVEIEESLNESVTPVSMPNQSWGYRYNTAKELKARFTPTDILEQEFKHFIVQLVDEDGTIRVPVQAYGRFISETKFVSKFLKIGELELETKTYKSFKVKAYHIERRDALIEAHNKAKERAAAEDKELNPPIEQAPNHLPYETPDSVNQAHSSFPAENNLTSTSPPPENADELPWELPPLEEKKEAEPVDGGEQARDQDDVVPTETQSGKHLTLEKIDGILHQIDEEGEMTQSLPPKAVKDNIDLLITQAAGYSLTASKHENEGSGPRTDEETKSSGEPDTAGSGDDIEDLIKQYAAKDRKMKKKQSASKSKQEEREANSIQRTARNIVDDV